MTPAELKAARLTLGLTRHGMALMLDTDETTVKRWETDLSLKSHRPAPARAERLIQAYLDGWRPEDWPQEEKEAA